MSSDLTALVQSARAALNGNRLPEAKGFARQAVQLQPQDRDARLILAMVEARMGHDEPAIKLFQGLTDSFDAHFWLSLLYRKQTRWAESLFHARKALELNPREPNLYSNLALILVDRQELAEAKEVIENAIRLAPQNPRNFELLGKVLWLQGRENQAWDTYAQAAKLGPASPDAMLVLAQIAAAQNRYDEAVGFARGVLERQPGATLARLTMAGALIDSGKATLAHEQIEEVLKSDPDNATAQVLAAMRLESMGKTDEARVAYRRSIDLEPNQGLAYCALVRSGKLPEADQTLLNKMEELTRSDAIPPRGKSSLHFGLGKGYDDLGEYERAIHHFDQANEIAYRLRFGQNVLDRSKLTEFVDRTIQVFTPKRLFEAEPDPCAVPIFIVGMMRSGTSLVEQILSSHPDVEGAGEQSFWLRHTAGKEELRELKNRYLKQLRAIFPNAPHITDKMPGNYRILGQIACAFPSAKIVHTKRHPVDTCLSIYFTPNRVANEFANDRENIVFAYRQYRRLMDHWEAVLGPERLTTAEYETLVSNPEPTVRGLVDFCELPWDDCCLRPETNERSVVTPSVWQVRQPVYTSSVERWRRYERWLGAFAELLD